MTQEQLDELTKKTELDIEHLQKEIKALKEKLEPVATDCSLCNVTRAEALNEQEIDAKILLQNEDRLDKLMQVLHNIGSKEYGICIVCDEEINIERLKILPEATICIDCANEN